MNYMFIFTGIFNYFMYQLGLLYYKTEKVRSKKIKKSIGRTINLGSDRFDYNKYFHSKSDP